MASSEDFRGTTRRRTLAGMGMSAFGAAFGRTMSAGARTTDFRGEPGLSGGRSGTKILVLGGGLAGMLSAFELRKAGYQVRILEFQNRPGGRNISLRGGDTLHELGGATQNVSFAAGNYFNPGPWRIPYHHQGILHYCRAFGVQLEPFVQFNQNAWLHSSKAFGGRPVRYREYASDFYGYTAETLAKAADLRTEGLFDTDPERSQFRAAMTEWGGLTPSGEYVKGERSSFRRGFSRPQGGGPDGAPVPSAPYAKSEILDAQLWKNIAFFNDLEMQETLFQPVGGMDQIGRAFYRRTGDLMTLNAMVKAVHQGEKGVTVIYEDTSHPGNIQSVDADYCVCTIPLSILSQLDIQVSAPMRAAISAVPYLSSVKIGLEFRRRFWEEDDQIYGGITFTDQPITQISYPAGGFLSPGPAVLLGGYMFDEPAAYDFAGMTPAERIENALAQGERIHTGYRKEYRGGVAVAWSRMPWTLGCCALWSQEARAAHYRTLCGIDNRIILAGEHVSWFCGWQEGAILSAADAVTRLHRRIVQSG
ncbi:NAD(P)-binding protein [Acetobacter musti]|uniref:Tryptophan 2-monooxygenase n=1 Tax=Acetobacter musti TaxID=864732 RepID=A0ABX0JN69_9PROT|nr:NAD(P)-binding protein [Acetobacter musti]